MMGARRWTAVSSAVTVVVFLVAGSGATAHSVVPEERGTRRPAAAPVMPSQSSAVAEQARHDGVDVNEVVDTVRRRRMPDRAGAVAARPRLGPQHRVADAVPGPAKGDQYRPRIAFDGTNYLVVWTDWRSSGGVEFDSDIFGARVSRSGAVLDATGMPISTVPGEQFGPDLAFDGANFLVVWEARGDDGSSDIFGARVSPSGAVLDLPAITIAEGAGTQFQSAVAFDGTNLLVVWATDGGVAGSRVSPAGLVLDGAGIPISGVSGFEPAISFDGTNYLVVWTVVGATYDLSGALVSRQGTVVAGRAIVADPGDQREAAVAFDGTNYLVTWTDNRVDVNGGDIYGTRVDTAGNALDPARIHLSPVDGYQFGSAIAFDGTNFLVTWVDTRDGGGVRGARVSRAGVVLDAGGVPIATEPANSSAVAFDGTNFFVMRTSSVVSPSDAVGVRVTTAVSVLGEDVVVSTSANAQTAPTLAFDGTDYLVVWADYRHGDTEIFGARVTPTGRLLDGAGFLIAAPGASFLSDPAVAFDGTNFLVAWSIHDSDDGHGDLRAARVSRAGVVLDGTGIPISTAPTSKSGISIAFDGSNYLVVWLDSILGAEVRTFGARVSRAGAVVDGVPILIVQRYPKAEPAVAFDGANFLVTGIASFGQVYWTRVAPSGRVLDLHAITARPASSSEMAVASDGTNSLVVWTDERDGTNSIYGTRVDRSGNALEPSGFPISTAPGDQRQPAVIANGPFLVVWRDERRGMRQYDVYGSRVHGNGQVIDRTGFAIAATPAAEVLPAVAAGPGDRFGVVTQRFVVGAPYGTQRVFLRTVAPK